MGLSPVILAATAMLSAIPAAPPQAAAAPATRAAAVQVVMRSMEGSPAVGELWRALKAVAPTDTLALAGRLVTLSEAGKDTQASGVQGMAQLVKANSHYAKAAPDSDLISYATRMADELRTLQAQDPQACVIINSGRADAKASDATLKRATASLIHQQSILMQTARMGRVRPTDHAKPDPADMFLYRGAIEQLGSGPRDFADIARLDRAPRDQRCRLEILAYAAVSTLPPASAGRIAAAMIKDR